MQTPIERLTDIVNDPKYQEFAEGLAELRTAFFDDAVVFAHLNGVAIIMPRLKEAANGLVPAVAEEDE